jgi:hypothetical protein
MREILDPEPVWTFGKNVTGEYLKHMDARQRTEEGEFVESHPHDHLRDCEKMQVGALSALGCVGDGEKIIDIEEWKMRDFEK